MGRFLKKKEQITGAALREALTRSQPNKFEEAIKEVYKAGGGEVEVTWWAHENAVGGNQGNIPVFDILNDKDFFGAARKKFGNGIFGFLIYGKDKKEHSSHYFALGPQKDTRGLWAKASDDSDSEEKGARTSDRAIVNKITDKWLDDVGSNNGFDMQRWMEYETSRAERAEKDAERRHEREQKDAERRHELQMEEIKQNQGGGGGSEIIGAFMQGFQLRGEVQPQIQPEDGLTQIAAAALPFIGNLLARAKPGQQFTPQQAQDAMRAELARSAAGQVAGPAQAPAPGVSLGGPGGNGDTAPEAPAPPEPGSIEYFHQEYLDRFRRDAAAGAPDDELAHQIIAMINYALDRMPGNPPEILTGFLAAETIIDYSAALMEFFAAIPELANLQQRQAGIREALVARLMPGATEAAAEVVEEPKIVQMSPEEEAAQSATVQEETDYTQAAGDDSLREYVDEEDAESVEDGDRTIVRETLTEEGNPVQDQSDESPASAELQDENIPSGV